MKDRRGTTTLWIADQVRNDGLATIRSIVILDLIQNPQGGAENKTNQPIIPSPLMGEESKVRVTVMRKHRHCGLDPQSRGA